MINRYALSLLTLALMVGTGCKDVRIASGTDDAYLHAPSELEATPPPPSESLFPSKIGSRWVYRFTDGEEGTAEDTRVPSLSTDEKGTVVFQEKREKTPVRRERYLLTEKQLLQLSATGNDTVMLDPPIPIYRLPLRFDETLTWQGTVAVKGMKAQSQAFSRLRAVEKVKVPAGTFTAYRFDTILETRLTEGRSRFWTTRWLAPGIGMVKVRYIMQIPQRGERGFSKELVSYKL